MFEVGQVVSTRYGNGTVIGVGSVKPHVYVRVHASANAIYIININDVTTVDASDFSSQAPGDRKSVV
jgi:hypothetical protein